MSSYASYCQDQAAACARRARLARSPEIIAYCRSLELRWRRLAEQAQETGGALGRERVAEPHSLFDMVRCKARALAEQMDDPEAKRTILKNADGYERLAGEPKNGRSQSIYLIQ
jgi:hypothetical protein